MSVRDLVAVHLKDICHWEGMNIKPMIDLQCVAELSKNITEECSAGVSHVSSPDISLRSTDITDDMIYEVRWHCVHGTSDWYGQYLDRDKEMNLLSGKSKLQEASSAIVFKRPGW